MRAEPPATTTAFPGLPIDDSLPASRKLRVCVASFDFVGPVRNGGVGTAFTSLAEGLARAGHDVTCLFLAGKWCENRTLQYWIEDYQRKGIKFVPLPESGLRYETAWHIAKAYEGYLWLKDQGFDVIHFSEWKGPGYFALCAKRQGLAFDRTLICVHTHGPTLWHKLSNGEYVTSVDDVHMDYLECQSVQMAEVLVSPSQYLLRWMGERNWVLPAKTFVQPYLRPATARTPLADADRCHQINELVFFGRLEVRKGLVLFCDALDLLKDDPALRHASLTFLGKADKIGHRESADYLADRAKNWPWKWQLISDRDQVGAMDYLQGSGRLAVVPSLVDNLPNTVLECLGAQVPFIASNAGGIPEMIAVADLEATCFPLQPRAFADKLRHVLLNGIRPASPAWDAQANESIWVKWHENQLVGHPPLCLNAALELSASPPLVSVCMSHWNRPHYLKQALASIEAMDYPNYEIVLVDDGSTTPEALKMIDELAPDFVRRGWQLLRNSENRYPGASRNLAARHAHGEYILFMDDDNCAKPHELSTFLQAARQTGADILTCCLDTFTGTTAPHAKLLPRSRWVFVGADAATGAVRNCFGDTNSLVRREVFLALGGFHEDWGVGHEDWEFFAKAVLAGYKLEVVPEALAWYRLNEAEQTVNRKTPVHRNHMANIRPYLSAVPLGLKNLVLLAQGQDLLLARGAGAARLPDPAELKLIVSWQAKIEAAHIFIQKKREATAKELLLEAVSTIEAANRPGMLFEVLLTVGLEMRSLDQRYAQQMFRQAVQLAKALKNDSMQQLAAKYVAASENQAREAASNVIAPVSLLGPTAVEVPLVSIIIPIFNNLALTRGCLESILRSPVKAKFEIIVVDNASTDGSAGFLLEQEKTQPIRVITNLCNEGFARACNQGAKAARGSLLLFLNNDTKATAGWLDALVQAAHRPQTGVVGAKLLYADGTIQHAGIGFINNVPDHPYRHAQANAPEVNQFRELDMVTGACLLIRAELFGQLVGFDEVFRNGVEDIDLCLRARSAGWKVAYEPKAVVYHLEGQSAGRFDHVNENLQLFFSRWGKSFDSGKRLRLPQPAKIINASRSFLLADGPVKPAEARVDWIGSFLDHGSLSQVNRELTGALRKRDSLRLKLVASGAAVDSVGFPELAREVATNPSDDAVVTVRHSWPPDWARPASGKLVVMQPWEFGILPEDWVRQSSKVDEFWAYTNYVRQVYISSGVDAAKVKVVPLGIDPSIFRPAIPPRSLATAKRFKFLFVGGTIHRKGPDLLLAAYLRTFTSADDVCLVIKDFGGNGVYAGQTLEARIKALQAQPGAPEILYLNEEMPPEALPGLFTACDCFVHPYRGEGFGLPILEAMACGVPVVLTAGGSADDFATDEFAYRIPAMRKSIGDSISGLKLVGEGWLLEPDAAALAERMKWVVAHQAEARAKGLAASEHVRLHWTWDRAAVVAEGYLRELVARAEKPALSGKPVVVRKPVAKTVPAVAQVGNLATAQEHFRKKSPRAAWESALEAIRVRPFHPEAYLLLAEIARLVGDAASAKQCARHALELAPQFKAATKFLKGELRGTTKPEWLTLPEACQTPAANLKPRLSVCLIVKNEERFLDQCLRSVKDLADEIVVVDTGSTDRTVEIATAHGAAVYPFTWCDDFSAARNAALEHATGDWVLALDADEELPAENQAALRQLLCDAAVMAWRLPISDAGREAEGCSYVPRLFRNAPGLHFVGRVHEQVFSSVETRCKEWGLTHRLGDAALCHHGYTKEIVKERGKVERNLRLLELAVEEIPDDPAMLLNYGLELVRSGRMNEGLQQYRTAFGLMSGLSSVAIMPETREMLLTQFCSYLMVAKRHLEVVQVLTSPLARSGGLSASQHYVLGLAHVECSQFAEGAEQMRQCLAKRDGKTFAPINPEIRKAGPRHGLALCLWKAKEPAAADREFQQVIQEFPEAAALKLDYARFLEEQDKAVEAIQLLNELTTSQPNLPEAWLAGGQLALSKPDFIEVAVDWTAVALEHFPHDARVIAQRAEALLLSGQPEKSLPVWQQLGRDAPPAVAAAIILCSAVVKVSIAVPPPDRVAEISREFLRWYWHLVKFRAEATLLQLHEHVDALVPVLPQAAQSVQEVIAKLAEPDPVSM